MTSHDELSYYLSQGLAIRVDGITISDANLEHLNLILNEDDSYMKEYVNDQEGEIYAIEYQNQRIICKEYSRAGRLISQLIIYLLDSFQCHLRYIEQLFSDTHHPEELSIPQD